MSSKVREIGFSVIAMGKKELAKRGADARHVADVQDDGANPSVFQMGDDGELISFLALRCNGSGTGRSTIRSVGCVFPGLSGGARGRAT